VDLSLFTQAASSLNTAVTLAKSFVGLRDEANRLAAVTELLGQLSDAHSKLLAINIARAESAAEHEAVLREKRDLEEKVRHLEAQKADFERYALHELSPGVFVYARSAGTEGAEPVHYLCARCRSNGKKSILQRRNSGLKVNLACPECATTYLETLKTMEAPIPTVNSWMG